MCNQNPLLESKVWKDLDFTNVNLEMKVVTEKQFFSEWKFKKTSEGVESFWKKSVDISTHECSGFSGFSFPPFPITTQ